jgi:hypothetical protein
MMIERDLPDSVTSAIADHARARADYIAAAEGCLALYENMRRNRQTAAAAATTAAESADLWREKLRDSNGAMTKEIAKLRDNAHKDQELAVELQFIADDMNDVLYDRQWKANTARDRYLNSRLNAERAYLSYRFSLLFDKILNSEDGRELLSVIQSIDANLYEYGDLSKRTNVHEINRAIDEKSYRTSLLQAIVATPVINAMTTERTTVDTILNDLRDIPPRNKAEGQPGSFSLAMRNMREAEKTMLANAE